MDNKSGNYHYRLLDYQQLELKTLHHPSIATARRSTSALAVEFMLGEPAMENNCGITSHQRYVTRKTIWDAKEESLQSRTVLSSLILTAYTRYEPAMGRHSGI